MKTLNVYDKNSDLKCYDKNIFKTTEEFLKQFPLEYSNCYYRNLETLKLHEVDELEESAHAAFYDKRANMIVFRKKFALGHELFHMASYDSVNKKFAFYNPSRCLGSGLVEGMTEYSFVKAYNLDIPRGYLFEVFCVTMLEDIPNIFRPYFVPSYTDFMSLFPNKEVIHNFLKNIDMYTDMYMAYWHYYCSDNMEDKEAYECLDFRSIIDRLLKDLIDIELSVENDPEKLRVYQQKFLNYVNSNKLPKIFEKVYPDYPERASELVTKKIRKR